MSEYLVAGLGELIARAQAEIFVAEQDVSVTRPVNNSLNLRRRQAALRRAQQKLESLQALASRYKPAEPHNLAECSPTPVRERKRSTALTH